MTIPSIDPRSVGPYRILERLGEGGMGVVYLAEQVEPVRRKVALKLVKPGMDTAEVIARFESERQALARMNHPHVAQIFDAGATESGRPYFVMEYVEGVPIVEACDARSMDTAQRIELLAQVCRAVQHAHQKGVIHRDLKPSNVLISEVDGSPTPKVIDFGVAKATGSWAAPDENRTEVGRVIGTPAYMSPEQAEAGALAVDTRSDVYSLGVLLYELLVGALPFDLGRLLRDEGYQAVQHVMREVTPPRPSTRLEELGDTATSAARVRGAEPAALAKSLRGELDWIALRALEKDPERRYGTAAAMADDLERYLRGEAVHARAPSRGYLLRKAIARHRGAFAFAGTVVLLLAALATSRTLQAREIQSEADRAERNAELAEKEAERAIEQARLAEEESQTARATLVFLIHVFEMADPDGTDGGAVTARQILDVGAQLIRESLHDQPSSRFRALDTIGTMYNRIGLYGEAEELLEEATALALEIEGPQSSLYADALFSLGSNRLARGLYDEAEEALERARDTELGDSDRHFMLRANVLDELGTLYSYTNRNELALEANLEALRVREAVLGPDDFQLETSLNNVAAAHCSLGNLDRASEYFGRAVALWEAREEPPTASYAYLLNNLAYLEGELGNDVRAEELYHKALRFAEQGFDENHESVGAICEGLGMIYVARGGEASRAREHLTRAMNVRRAILPGDHPVLARSMTQLGELELAEQELDAARPLLEGGLEIRENYLGPNHPLVNESRVALARLELADGDVSSAEALLLEAIEAMADYSGSPGGALLISEARALLAEVPK